MPRVKIGIPERQREIEAQLRAVYGGSLGIGDLCNLLSTKERRTAAKFVAGVPHLTVGTRKRWRVEDLAREIYRQECCDD